MKKLLYLIIVISCLSVQASCMHRAVGVDLQNSDYKELVEGGQHKNAKKDRIMSLALLARLVLWSAHELVKSYQASNEISYTASTKITWCVPTPDAGRAYQYIASKLQEKMTGDQIRVAAVPMSQVQKTGILENHVEFLNGYYEPIMRSLYSLTRDVNVPNVLTVSEIVKYFSHDHLTF